MKNTRIGVALVALGVLLGGFASSASATKEGDRGDRYTCSAGTTHSFKSDNLSGPTFTVPTLGSGWTITGVVIKAGQEHYTYTPVTPGQVLQVKKDTGHDVSHAHICKGKVPPTTLPPTTIPPTTIPPTTIPPETVPPTTIPPTTVAPTTLPPTTMPPETTIAVSTTVVEQTTTVPPATTAPTPSSTVVPSTLNTVLETTTVPTSVPTTRLPDTGSSTTLLWIAALCTVLGGLVMLARRPRGA